MAQVMVFIAWFATVVYFLGIISRTLGNDARTRIVKTMAICSGLYLVLVSIFYVVSEFAILLPLASMFWLWLGFFAAKYGLYRDRKEQQTQTMQAEIPVEDRPDWPPRAS